jgi:hypothetical protein
VLDRKFSVEVAEERFNEEPFDDAQGERKTSQSEHCGLRKETSSQ